MNILESYLAALVAEATYADDLIDIVTGMPLSGDSLIQKLLNERGEEGLTEAQAATIDSQFNVVAQQLNTENGFSATLFQHKDSNKHYFSMRGSEPGDSGDWVISNAAGIGNAGVAAFQAIDMLNFYLELVGTSGVKPLQYELELVTNIINPLIEIPNLGYPVFEALPGAYYKIVEIPSSEVTVIGRGIPLNDIVVTGHSLGGHLATVFTDLFPNIISHTYTFDGAGVDGGVLGNNEDYDSEGLDAFAYMIGHIAPNAQGGSSVAEMTNFKNDVQGVNLAGRQLGDVTDIFIEESESGVVAGFVENHSVHRMAETMAVINFLNTIDASLGYDGATLLLEAISNDGQEQMAFETLLRSIGELAGMDLESELDIYSMIYGADGQSGLHTALGLTVATTEYAATNYNVSLPDADLAATATAGDKGALYALLNLNTLVLSGSDAQAIYDARSELDVENYSEEFLRDRALMLGAILQRNNDDTAFPAKVNGNSIRFTDAGIEEVFAGGNTGGQGDSNTVDPDTVINISFGDNSNNDLFGRSQNDRLYGMAGDDVLDGNGGDDYIEGGKGSDTLESGVGSDTLLGGEDKDTYIVESESGDVNTLTDTGTDDALTANVNEASDIYQIAGAGDTTVEDVEGEDNYSVTTDSGSIVNLNDHGSNNDTYEVTSGGIVNVRDAGGEDTYTITGVAGADIGITDRGEDKDIYYVSGEGDISIVDYGGNNEIYLTDFTGTLNIINEGNLESTSIFIDGVLLQGEVLADLQDNNRWTHGNLDITTNSPLTITAENDGQVIVEDFEDGDLGIIRGEAIVEPEGRFDLSAEINAIMQGNGGVGNYRIGLSQDGLNLSLFSSHTSGGQDSEEDTLQLITLSHSLSDINHSISMGDLNGWDGIYTGDGDDKIFANGGVDNVHAGGGNDIVIGGLDADALRGGEGDDLLYARGEEDYETAFFVDGEAIDSDIVYSTDDAPYGVGAISKLVAKDWVSGDEGDDTLIGDGNEDVLFGGSGQDIIGGGAGDDIIAGDGDFNLLIDDGLVTFQEAAEAENPEGDNDTLHGGSGNDQIYAGEGDDSVFGGDGDDRIFGGKGNDVISGGDGLDVIKGNEGNDEIYGGDGDDLILGEDGDDVITGGAGLDVLSGGDGIDLINGDAGDDQITGGAGDDELYGGEGDDIVVGDNGDDIISGGAGMDSLSGGEGIDTIDGGSDDDEIQGGAGNDELYGGEGNDSVVGDDGDDIIFGGAGVDILVGGDGIDIIDGGTGDDELQGGLGDDELHGNSGADLLFGQEGEDILFGGDGDDQLRGGEDDDELHGEEGADFIFGNEGSDTLFGGSGDDRLRGGDGNDVLYGGDGNDSIFGQGNNDTLFGGGGNDELTGEGGSDVINGGDGDDIILGDGSPSVDADGYDVISAYVANANGAADILIGGLGNDKIYGGEGNDSIDGGEGDDYLVGGDGNDTVDAGEGADTIFGGIGDDTLNGGDGNDYIDGDEGNDVLTGGGGDDEIYGEAGNDVIYGGLGADTIFGSAGNDTIDGGDGDDILAGGSGNDFVDGGEGKDILLAASGDDTLIVDEHDIVYVYQTSGKVFINGYFDELHLIDLSVAKADSTLSLIDNVLVMTFEDSSTEVHFNSYNSESPLELPLFNFVISDFPTVSFETLLGFGVVIAGSDSDDLIEGTDIADEISGRDGNDTINGYAGADRLLGDAGDDVLNGMAGDDTLEGGDGNDILTGGDGTDRLNGNDGDDILRGGNDIDYLVGGAGNDTYLYDIGDDKTLIRNYDSGAGRHDVLRFLDGINPADITIERDSNNNNNLKLNISNTDDYVLIEDFFLGSDYELSSIEFADGTAWDGNFIRNSLMTITEGGDTINGFVGNDIIDALGGDDVVYAGKGDDVVFGGDGNDHLYGQDGDDVLRAGTSNGGRQTVTGGDGSDVYIFGLSDGSQTIYNQDASTGRHDVLRFIDGIVSSDIELSRFTVEFLDKDSLIITILQTGESILIDDFFLGDDYQLNAIEFSDGEIWDANKIKTETLGITNQDDVITAYDSDDVINALAGNDSVHGGDGNDTIFGGDGNDSVYGDEGNDTLYGGSGNDFVIGGVGDDLVHGDSGDDILNGNDGNDVLHGNSGNDFLSGGVGDDILDGGTGVDELSGGDGNDILRGGVDDGDVLKGDAGNDIYLYGLNDGNTTINNYDSDIQSYDSLHMLDGIAPSDVSVYRYFDDLVFKVNSTGSTVIVEKYFYSSDYEIDVIQFANGTSWNEETLRSFLSASTAGDDVISGLNGNDNLSGGDGNDEIYGGGGNDVLLGDAGDDMLFGEAGDDLLMAGEGEDELNGGDGNDTLIGGAGKDILLGGAGDDVLRGGGGVTGDHLQSDFLHGSTGSDTYLFGLGDGDINISSYEHFFGSHQDKLLLLEGVSEDDIWIQNDHFGNLNLHIISTNERVLVYNYFDVGEELHYPITVEFSDGTVWDRAHLNSILGQGSTNDDYFHGTDFSDTLFGMGGDDFLNGRAGDDFLYGGDGNDWIEGGDGADTIYAGDGDDRWVHGDAGDDVIYGEGGNDSLWGYEGDDFISGGSGDDSIFGNLGNDVLRGGAGDDFLFGGLNSDTFLVGLGDGHTRISTSNTRNIYSDNLVPDPYPDTHPQDILKFLDGISQDDVAVDSLNQDLYLTVTSGETVSVNSFFTATEEHRLSQIQFDDGTVWKFNEIKAMMLTNSTINGTDNADVIAGTEFDDYIYAKGGDDVVYGGGGINQIDGGDGDDRLFAGVYGGDLAGGNGDDSLHGNYGGNTIIGGEGNDLILGHGGVDNLDGGLGDDTIYAGSTIYGGSEWSKATLSGGDGRDKLFGGNGEDTLDGGAGDDVIYSGGTLLAVDDGGGIYGGGIYGGGKPGGGKGGLPGAYGGGSVYGGGVYGDGLIGGEGNDSLYATTGYDNLDGGEGNDYLSGGVSADTLTGGEGDDTYYFQFDDTLKAEGFHNNDNIVDNYDTDGGVDVIEIDMDGATAANSYFERRGDDLYIATQFGDIDLTIEGFFLNPDNYAVDEINFNDGSTLTKEQILNWDIANYAHVQANTDEFAIDQDGVIEINPLDLMNNDYEVSRANNENVVAELIDASSYQINEVRNVINGSVSVDENTGFITFTAGSGFNGIASFEYNLGDETWGVVEIQVGEQANVIEGGNGNDAVVGTDGDDIIIGGTGNDTLRGGLGDDTFIVEGIDQGADRFIGGEGVDTVQGGNGDDVFTLSHSVLSDSIEAFDGGAGSNTIVGTESNNSFDFSNTTLTNIDSIDAGAGNDRVTGSASDDVMIGGTGNDTLRGGIGSDEYQFGNGDGIDNITVSGFADGDLDTLSLTDIDYQNLWFSQSGNHLLIDVIGTNDQVRLSNWFTEDHGSYDVIHTDGYSLAANQVDQLINAMAAFDVPTGVGAIVPTEESDLLAPTLASTWSAA
jgi:Ca2+-binding RTX toxin-like protein